MWAWFAANSERLGETTDCADRCVVKRLCCVHRVKLDQRHDEAKVSVRIFWQELQDAVKDLATKKAAQPSPEPSPASTSAREPEASGAPMLAHSRSEEELLALYRKRKAVRGPGADPASPRGPPDAPDSPTAVSTSGSVGSLERRPPAAAQPGAPAEARIAGASPLRAVPPLPLAAAAPRAGAQSGAPLARGGSAGGQGAHGTWSVHSMGPRRPSATAERSLSPPTTCRRSQPSPGRAMMATLRAHYTSWRRCMLCSVEV